MDAVIQFFLVCFAGIVLVVIIGATVLFVSIRRLMKDPAEEEERAPTDPPPRAIEINTFESHALLYPTGREVFFPEPPHPKPVYEITLVGFLQGENGRLADAFYETDGKGNYRRAVHSLSVNGGLLHYASFDMVNADRCEHRYTVRIDHRNERLTLAIADRKGWHGALAVRVIVLPEGTPGVAEQHEREQQLQIAKREDRLFAQKFAAAIEELCVRAEVFRNWENPEFQNKFAQVHYDELIHNQAEIREEALTFLSQHGLVRYLRRHHPAVVRRFTGRLEALLIAERIAIETRSAPALPPVAPKRKLTADEVRAIKIHRQQVQDGDKVALKLDKIATRLQIRERLAQLPLDSDERDMIEQEVIREIEEGDDPSGKTL